MPRLDGGGGTNGAATNPQRARRRLEERDETAPDPEPEPDEPTRDEPDDDDPPARRAPSDEPEPEPEPDPSIRDTPSDARETRGEVGEVAREVERDLLERGVPVEFDDGREQRVELDDPAAFRIEERDGELVTELTEFGEQQLEAQARDEERRRIAEEEGVDTEDVRVVEDNGDVRFELAEDVQRERAAEQFDGLEAEDLRVVERDGERVIEPTDEGRAVLAEEQFRRRIEGATQDEGVLGPDADVEALRLAQFEDDLVFEATDDGDVAVRVDESAVRELSQTPFDVTAEPDTAREAEEPTRDGPISGPLQRASNVWQRGVDRAVDFGEEMTERDPGAVTRAMLPGTGRAVTEFADRTDIVTGERFDEVTLAGAEEFGRMIDPPGTVLFAGDVGREAAGVGADVQRRRADAITAREPGFESAVDIFAPGAAAVAEEREEIADTATTAGRTAADVVRDDPGVAGARGVGAVGAFAVPIAPGINLTRARRAGRLEGREVEAPTAPPRTDIRDEPPQLLRAEDVDAATARIDPADARPTRPEARGEARAVDDAPAAPTRDPSDLPLQEQIAEAGDTRRWLDFVRDDRGAAPLAGPRSPRREPRTRDPTREMLEGSPRDRISDDITARAMEHRRMAEGTFEPTPRPFADDIPPGALGGGRQFDAGAPRVPGTEPARAPAAETAGAAAAVTTGAAARMAEAQQPTVTDEEVAFGDADLAETMDFEAADADLAGLDMLADEAFETAFEQETGAFRERFETGLGDLSRDLDRLGEQAALDTDAAVTTQPRVDRAVGERAAADQHGGLRQDGRVRPDRARRPGRRPPRGFEPRFEPRRVRPRPRPRPGRRRLPGLPPLFDADEPAAIDDAFGEAADEWQRPVAEAGDAVGAIFGGEPQGLDAEDGAPERDEPPLFDDLDFGDFDFGEWPGGR